MSKKSATQELVIVLAKQVLTENLQCFSWFITSMLMSVGEDESQTLKDYLITLKAEIPEVKNIIEIQNEKCFRNEI